MPNLLDIKIPWLWSILVIIVCGTIIWGIMSPRLITSPPRDQNKSSPEEFDLAYEKVEFTSTDGLTLKGWFIPHLFNQHNNALQKGAEFIPSREAKGTIILCHGFGTSKSDLINFIPFLHKGHYNVFMFDFRAHGDSPGLCSLGYYEVNDLTGAINYLKTRPDVDAGKIGAIGISMGGAVAFMTAARNSDLKAVVSDSSFMSFERTVTKFAKLFYNLPKFPFVYITIKAVEWRLHFEDEEADPVKYIGQISPRAVFIIHGAEDQRVLPEDARVLYEAAREPKQLWMVPEADHLEAHGLWPAEYEKKIIDFFDKYL